MLKNFKPQTQATSWFNDPSAVSQPLVSQRTRTQNSRKKPSFLWTAKDETKKIVILDPVPLARIEFHIDSANNYERVPCIKQHDVCPLCESADTKGSRFSRAKPYILLTVIDTTPWTTSDGKVIPYSKKIFAVETEAQRKVIEKYLNKYGTTRGMVLELSRSGAKGEGSCGIAIFEEMMSEAELKEKFFNKEIKADDGRVLKKEGVDIEVVDYADVFRLPTSDELRTKYNMASTLGAKQSFEEEEPPFDVDSDFDPDDYESVAD